MSDFQKINFESILNPIERAYKQRESTGFYNYTYRCERCHKPYLVESGVFLSQNEEKFWGYCFDCRVKSYLKRIGFNENYHEVNQQYLENKTNKGTLKTVAERFINNLDMNLQNGKGLLIFGSYGTYKTHFMAHIARQIFQINEDARRRPELFRKQINVHYFTVNQITDRFMKNKAGGYHYLRKMKIVFLDDFGGYMTEPEAGMLDEIYEIFYSKRIITIVSTNMKPTELTEYQKCRRTIDVWREKNISVVLAGDGFRDKGSINEKS